MRSPEELKKAIAFLVVSYDGYSDLWKPYFELFRRYWPDCPLRVYLLSNQLSPPEPWVESIQIGKDVSWSDNLLKALERIEQPYLVLGIEDQFLIDRVDSTHATAVFSWIVDHQPNYVRLLPTPPPDAPHDALMGLVEKGTVYRASTVYCVWKKSALLSILRAGESAWAFEIDGGSRSDALDHFYCVREEALPISHGVVLGRWVPAELKRLRALGVAIDTTRRAVMTPWQALMFDLRGLRSRVFRTLVPVKWSRAVRKALQR